MKKKHVIFLGAGASASSGYPVGQELRLLMSSRELFIKQIQKAIEEHSTFSGDLAELFDEFGESIKLFRRGGFATVDEFSKLASGSYPEHVQNMKRLMRLVLILHNPEDRFEDSNYYPFVQKLFRPEELSSLRNEITVITINYDCYLDLVLSEAYRHRQSIQKIPTSVKNHPEVLEGPQPLNDLWAAKLSSGFVQSGSAGALAWQIGQFNFFKLHGSLVYYDDRYFGYNMVFGPKTPEWMTRLEQVIRNERNIPPVVFPWEIMRPHGIVNEEQFIFFKEANSDSDREAARRLYKMFELMWKSARGVVQAADKISFVGLAMHEYLNDGLRYLLSGFADDKPDGKRVEVVVANPVNKEFKDARNRIHPASPCGKVASLLGAIAPKLHYIRSSAEDDGMIDLESIAKGSEDKWQPEITPRYSFEDFIRTEMN